jgi:GT2 family glycosyltransferase
MIFSPFNTEIAMSGIRIELSVIIVTWNTRRFAWECLDSLRIYRDDPNVEIIVVDNASSDGTPEVIEQEFPWVHLIRNSENLGFARANNIGMIASTGKYVCLVNSDVTAPPDCLPGMHAYMEANPAVGMLGPQMLCPNGLIGRSYMRFPTVWRGLCDAFAMHRIFRRSKAFSGIIIPDFDNSHTAEVDVLNGWFLMVRREALNEVGMLDEQFFMYGEDIDWSYRFYRAGWKRVYFSEARAFHYGGASSAVTPTRFYIEMRRANLQLLRKHTDKFKTYGYLVATLLHETLRVMGNGILILRRKSDRSKAVLKMTRSIACIQWLVRRPMSSTATTTSRPI